ncbi:MAG: Molybdopterin-synthase adenylyltransferase [uncultured Phycisphaerae bacterium]|uniref:Molybdopterin-synthase adenylyltransferase n=1 Tax=uncultured Phycisphaerae bacterium TaxID=904963 RepID=A0A6J4NNR5_9BACT|nr:MAG: Molybdopterin-synthase adenylyltransferase [uncultured Phycisphaerae bacterium]
MTQTATPRATPPAPVTQLSSDQVNRYKRHLILPEVGVEGQMKLLNARVLCIGAGGLGCPISLYLAAAGVGTIGLADVDVVSPSNLQRQVLFGVSNVGEDKVVAAAKRLRDVNPDCNVVEHKTVVNSSNVLDLIRDYDIVIDGTDNFPTRYCVNDACVIARKPNVYGSIFRFEGMITVFAPHLKNPDTGEQGPCYRCMYPEPPDPGSVPSCAEGGVVGVLPGIIGTLQANEVIKLILGIGRPANGRLVTFSSMDMEFKTFKIRRDRECPVCGDAPTITEPIDYEQFCGAPILDPKSAEETAREVENAKSPKAPGSAGAAKPDPSLDARGLPPGYAFKPDWEVTPRDVKAMQDRGDEFVFIDCRLPNEAAITAIPGAKLIPLQQLAQRFDEIKDRYQEKVVVHCRSGARSLQFAQALRQAGFKDVKSMAGGILLWNKDVNPGGPQY